MNKRFVGIIGQQNHGKSTIIRSLTGVPTMSYRGFIKDCKDNEIIYVFASSPQEDPIDRGAFIKCIKDVRKRKECRGVICAIQPNQPYKNISLENIYEAVKQIGGFTSYAFLLNPGRDKKNKKELYEDVNGRIQGPIHNLDANRFAYRNAAIIDKKTNIIGKR